MSSGTRPGLGTFTLIGITILACGYFTFAAVQGDYGLLRRVQIRAEAEALRAERDRLAAELAEVQNRTRRLSDAYLDLDLLDEQVRDVLGYVRGDEVVIR